MKRNLYSTKKTECGMSLIELMIAILVLAVGMGSLLMLFLNASVTDNRNMRDTSGTLLGQMILEQISSQSSNSNAAIIVTDCAGTQLTVASTGGPGPNGLGADLNQTPSSLGYGGIDQTQQYSAIPANYAMKYTDCDTNGQQAVYEVRWNVMTITANTTRLITVSARQANLSSNQLGSRRFSIPVTLRGIGGP